MAWFKDLFRASLEPIGAALTGGDVDPGVPPVAVEPVDTTAVAVNDPAPVTLYTPDGKTATVAAADVPYFTGLGFRRARWLPEEAVDQLLPRFDSAKAAVQAYLTAVQSAGAIDTHADADMRVAEVAMEGLLSAWSEVHRAIHQHYPVQQGAPARLYAPKELWYGGKVVAKAGEEFSVDPNQVEFWKGQGATDVPVPTTEVPA